MLAVRQSLDLPPRNHHYKMQVSGKFDLCARSLHDMGKDSPPAPHTSSGKMTGEYRQSEEELQEHLRDTLQAVELSACAFDDGHDGEAKRLAAAIRVLVYDTRNSRSLLGQLGLKAIPFYDTSILRHPKSIMTYNGITATDLTSQGATYVAPLDELPPDNPPKRVSFAQWWNGVIFVDQGGRETTRGDLILAVANKDGGSHVDPVLDEKYANLSRRNALAWHFSGPRGDVPLKSPERAAVRQIAHEVLKSINPAMPIVKPKVRGVLFMGAGATVEEKLPIVPKVGRNEPCPCRSGKKYKRCHGKDDHLAF